MKRTIMLYLVCLSPLFLGANMDITTHESVSNELVPDILRGELSFEEENKNANVIKEHLNAIVAEVKRFDAKGELCRGGGYHLYPRYSYKDQTQTFVGYSGTLSFSCELGSVEQYNALVSGIEKVKASSVLTNQGALAWVVSDKVRDTNRLALRSSLLNVANEQAHAFSKETKMRCDVQEIAFDDTKTSRPVLMRPAAAPMAKSFSSTPTQEPLVHNETVLLGATVRYTCATQK